MTTGYPLPRYARRCASCRRVFSGITAFDEHHVEHFDRAGPPYVDCGLTDEHWWNEKRRAWSYGEYQGPEAYAEAKEPG